MSLEQSQSTIVEPRWEQTQTQTQTPVLLAARTAELRSQAGAANEDARDLDHVGMGVELAQLTQAFEQRAPQELLDELGDERGLAWALVARAVGVTPAAVRKWRRGERVTPAYRHALAEFAAFCQILQQRNPRIDEVGEWLEMPAASGSDASRADLYIDGHRTELLDIARELATGEQLLDLSDPSWRERAATARNFEVLEHEDGTRSIVVREEHAEG